VELGIVLTGFALPSAGALLAVDSVFHHLGGPGQLWLLLHWLIPSTIAGLLMLASLELAWLLGVREPPERWFDNL
jgi:hypothetical protein